METFQLKEIKIYADNSGTLFAALSSGEVKKILVDVHDLQHYGVLRIDANTVQHAHWILNKDGSGTCSECGHKQMNCWDMDNQDNFCHFCGADMKGR